MSVIGVIRYSINWAVWHIGIELLFERTYCLGDAGHGNVLPLTEKHMFLGNQESFEVGLGPIRVDAEWEERLGRVAKAVVTACTFPLLLRYGYKIRT